MPTTEIAVQKVEIVNGDYFTNVRWRSRMQIIYTDKGLFIDNVKGKGFRSSSSGFGWKGIDWQEHIGKTVEIIVVNDFGREIYRLGFDKKEDLKNCDRKERAWAYPFFKRRSV